MLAFAKLNKTSFPCRFTLPVFLVFAAGDTPKGDLQGAGASRLPQHGQGRPTQLLGE